MSLPTIFNKSDLASLVNEKLGYTKKESKKFIASVQDAFEECLVQNRKLTIRNCFTMTVVRRKARRNNLTGGITPARNAIKMKRSKGGTEIKTYDRTTQAVVVSKGVPVDVYYLVCDFLISSFNYIQYSTISFLNFGSFNSKTLFRQYSTAFNPKIEIFPDTIFLSVFYTFKPSKNLLSKLQ
jgi:nucleoid DNA-binding protein